jgi:hypothetical protein
MRRAVLFLFAILSAGVAFSQTVPFSEDFPSGGKLRLHVRSGDVHILGTAENRISVEVSGRRAEEARKEFKVAIHEKHGETELRILGGPKNDIQITVRIPRRTDLYARIPFGDVTVENVVGDKDVELHAGDLTIAVGDASDYARVDASVYSGDLDGAPFRENHGGLFRSFHKEGTGKYRLHAHVGAGDLRLQ